MNEHVMKYMRKRLCSTLNLYCLTETVICFYFFNYKKQWMMEFLFVEGRLQCTHCRGVHKEVSCLLPGKSWAVQQQSRRKGSPHKSRLVAAENTLCTLRCIRSKTLHLHEFLLQWMLLEKLPFCIRSKVPVTIFLYLYVFPCSKCILGYPCALNGYHVTNLYENTNKVSPTSVL
jgi:hypothetical protein